MPVSARRFIRKMRGGAQAHLLEADDGRFYIVKFQNNPQHRRILINETIAAEILAHMQVASPEYQFVRISPEFIAANPDCHIQLGTRRVAVEPGWHFGSRHPGNPDTLAIYDFIPDALLNQVANAEQFRAVLVFDRWVSNTDGRQSVFFRALLKDWLAGPGVPPGKLGFVALMIDHGFAFNGPHWDLPDSAIAGLYPRRIVYDSVKSIDDFEPWIARILNFPPAVLDRALRQIPPEWLLDDGPALEKLLEALMRRKNRIGDLVTACHKAFPRWVPSGR
ncbi:MAG: HipA family kinase [Terriglobia bacterium]